MNKNTRTALIKRECLLVKDIMQQSMFELTLTAHNNTKTLIVDDFCDGLQKIIDDFDKRNESERTTIEYIDDCLETDELIEQYITQHEETIKNMANIMFDEYMRLFNESPDDVELSIDMLIERLHGIATVSQVKREFLKLTGELDELGVKRIEDFSNKLIQDLDIKINEITGGFAYEFIQVCKFLREVFDNETEQKTTNSNKQLQKITSTRKMQQVITDSGYNFKRQNGTSHRIYENEHGDIVVLPIHSTIKVGLAYGIQKTLK